MPEPIPVRVRDCACPDTPHADGDIVYLAPTLTLDGGLEATQIVITAQGQDPGVVTRRLLAVYVRHGVVGANFIEPFSVDAILADYSLAWPVADKASDLYDESVLRPLGVSRPSNSPHGQTDGSTSRTRRSARK